MCGCMCGCVRMCVRVRVCVCLTLKMSSSQRVKPICAKNPGKVALDALNPTFFGPIRSSEGSHPKSKKTTSEASGGKVATFAWDILVSNVNGVYGNWDVMINNHVRLKLPYFTLNWFMLMFWQNNKTSTDMARAPWFSPRILGQVFASPAPTVSTAQRALFESETHRSRNLKCVPTNPTHPHCFSPTEFESASGDPSATLRPHILAVLEVNHRIFGCPQFWPRRHIVWLGVLNVFSSLPRGKSAFRTCRGNDLGVRGALMNTFMAIPVTGWDIIK